MRSTSKDTSPERSELSWTRRLISKCEPDCNVRRLPTKHWGLSPLARSESVPVNLNLVEEIELTVKAIERIAGSRNLR